MVRGTVPFAVTFDRAGHLVITEAGPSALVTFELHSDGTIAQIDAVDTGQLAASEGYCWYSWPRQIESMARLAEYRFEWVLPGHGQRVYLPSAEMHTKMRQLVDSMAR